MRHKPVSSFIAVAVLAILSLSAATSFESRHSNDLAGNPSDLHFSLSSPAGQRTFHIGERIPLTLSFTSDTPAKYKLNAASYDRSGRLPTEEFVMEKDVPDPYLDYYGAGVLGGIGGGLRGNPVLGAEPVKIEVELNQWFRFERPGHYRFYLKSHRLSRESAPGESDRRTVEFAAVSNVVEIEILRADKGWAAAKLATLQQTLDPPAVAPAKMEDPPTLANPPDEHILQAWRELEYLATPQSVLAAFEIARKTGSSPHTQLLFAARDRQKTVAAFDAYLTDPGIALQQWDLRVRAAFTWLEKDKPKPLPIFVWQFPDQAGMQALQKLATERYARYAEVLRAEAVRWIPLLAAKDPAVRKTSTETIAALAPAEARAAKLVPPDDYGLTREQLIAQFLDFPEEQQSELLGRKWDLVRGPEMIPALLQILAKQKPRAKTTQAMPLSVWGAEAGIAISALQRLAQLSPSEIVRVIQDDIASGAPRFAGYAVRELPAQTLPAIDGALLSLLQKDYSATMPLVAKFASARLLDDVRRITSEHPEPCSMVQPEVSYFLRVVPEEDGEGRKRLQEALANRTNCGFFRFLLVDIARAAWNPAIQAEAIARLDDPDLEVARSAARVLAAHGGPEVEPPLWKRLERWSEQWRSRAAEVQGNPITGSGPNEERRLGTELFNSIATAQAWLLDEPRRKRLATLEVDARSREQWTRPRTPGPIPIEASNGGSIYPASFRVDGYTSATMKELKRKLQQFPAGAHFCWRPKTMDRNDGFSAGQRDAMFHELAAFLSEHSMKLESCSE